MVALACWVCPRTFKSAQADEVGCFLLPPMTCASLLPVYSYANTAGNFSACPNLPCVINRPPIARHCKDTSSSSCWNFQSDLHSMVCSSIGARLEYEESHTGQMSMPGRTLACGDTYFDATSQIFPPDELKLGSRSQTQ